jgi:methionyl-tRNA formyltransferase
MRAVVFAYHNMGTAGIRALLDHGFTIPMVLSHEDDPGENRRFGSVAEFCRERGIPVFSPKDVNAPPWPNRVRAASPDLLFSFCYRSMLKKAILEILRRPNDLARGSYFGGRRPEDGRIDWTRPAVEICNLVRAVTRPYPGAFAELAGEKLTVWRAIPLPAEVGGETSPGAIRVSGGPSYAMAGGCVAPVSSPRRIVVGTGDGWLQLEEIEWRTRTAKGEGIVDLLAGAANGMLA